MGWKVANEIAGLRFGASTCEVIPEFVGPREVPGLAKEAIGWALVPALRKAAELAATRGHGYQPRCDA